MKKIIIAVLVITMIAGAFILPSASAKRALTEDELNAMIKVSDFICDMYYADRFSEHATLLVYLLDEMYPELLCYDDDHATGYVYVTEAELLEGIRARWPGVPETLIRERYLPHIPFEENNGRYVVLHSARGGHTFYRDGTHGEFKGYICNDDGTYNLYFDVQTQGEYACSGMSEAEIKEFDEFAYKLGYPQMIEYKGTAYVNFEYEGYFKPIIEARVFTFRINNNEIEYIKDEWNPEMPEEYDQTSGKIAVGDINGDNELDNKDVVLLFRYTSGPNKNVYDAKYDFNGDGAVDNKDVVELFRTVSKNQKPNDQNTNEAPDDNENTSEVPDTTDHQDEPVNNDGYDFKAFDIDFAGFVSSKIKGNYMVSPLSVKYALGMLLEGADGETREQMMKALGLKDYSELENYIKNFNRFAEGFSASAAEEEFYYDDYDYEQDENEEQEGEQNETGGKKRSVITLADSIWKREGAVSFKEDYLLHLEMYNAEHFEFTPADVAGRVNAWCSEKTNGLIDKMMDEEEDYESLFSVLVNALYYKNSWEDPFYESGTGDFTTGSGSVVKKDYIASESDYRYYKDDGIELVIVPMLNNTEMIFAKGDMERMLEAADKASMKTVYVRMPKLDFDTTVDAEQMKEFLTKRGMINAFEDNADFSKMTDEPIKVDKIIHKTKIALDEKGVEAAAATVIEMNETETEDEPEPILFILDSTYGFAIRTSASPWADEAGTALFIGRVSE